MKIKRPGDPLFAVSLVPFFLQWGWWGALGAILAGWLVNILQAVEDGEEW